MVLLAMSIPFAGRSADAGFDSQTAPARPTPSLTLGAVGGILALAAISLLVPKVPASERPSYFNVYMAVATLMVVAVAVLVLTIREKKLAQQVDIDDGEAEDEEQETGVKTGMPREVRRSFIFILASIFLWFTAYNAVTTAFSRYATTIWGYQGGSFANALMVAMYAIVFFIPVGILSRKFGRKKMIIFRNPAHHHHIFLRVPVQNLFTLINLVFAFTGIAWASINVNSYPMVVEMSRGSDIGKYTGMYYTFSMAAQILTPIASGL